MWHSLKRWWKYLGVKVRVVHEERADPKVQLEQAILEAEVEEYENVKARTGQALLMIDREAREGRGDKVATYTAAAQSLANQVLGLECEIREREAALLQATRASKQAKRAVVQNSAALRSKLDEKERLLSALDRAKMQEALNDARGQFAQAPDSDAPSFAEVERKIRDREAVAQAQGELGELQRPHVDPAVLEIEAAQQSAEAQALLGQLRSQLGLAAPVEERRMLER